MKTLTAQEKTSELLRAGQVLSITGDALVERIGSGGVKMLPVKIAGSGTVGPFTNDLSVVISALSAISYGIDMKFDVDGVAVGTNTITPSSYVAVKTATTTATGQSEKIATGVGFIYVKNLDMVNQCKIGFGADSLSAELAVTTSINIADPLLEFNFPVPPAMTHYAWAGVTTTVSVIIGQK